MQKYLNINNDKMYIIVRGNYEASERQFLVINKDKKSLITKISNSYGV